MSHFPIHWSGLRNCIISDFTHELHHYFMDVVSGFGQPQERY